MLETTYILINLDTQNILTKIYTRKKHKARKLMTNPVMNTDTHIKDTHYQAWLGSLTVTCRTCNPEVTQRHRFDSAPGHCPVTTLGKLFTHMCLCHQAV